jgi:hypothetical protein
VGGKQFSLRHGVPGFGVLMWVELPLLAVGFFGLLNQRRVFVFLMGWIIIGLLPSIISVEAPHALRASAIIPPLMLVVGYGGITLLQITKSRFGNKGLRFTGLLLLLMYVTQYTQYVNTYYTTYAQASAIEFQFGMSEAAIAAQEYLNKGDRMVMTTVYGDPKYHVLTALGISPANFQAGSIRHMEFKPIQWPTNEANVVFVGTPTEIPITGDRVKTTILIPGTQTVVFVIAKT